MKSNWRVTLTTAAIAAKPEASSSAVTAPRPPPLTPKTKATIAAPIDCPSNRALLWIAPAPPLRSRGAAMTIARALGCWNSPIPPPHTAIRQYVDDIGMCREHGEQHEADAYDGEPDAAENAGRIAVGESAGE